METDHRDELERAPSLLHRLFAQSKRPTAPVQIKEHHHGPAVDLALTFSELSTYQAEALKRVATQLVDLTSLAREENFEARVRSIMRAFAPEDPEADALLKLAGDDARAATACETRRRRPGGGGPPARSFPLIAAELTTTPHSNSVTTDSPCRSSARCWRYCAPIPRARIGRTPFGSWVPMGG